MIEYYFIAVFLCVMGFTYLIRWYAIKRNMIDIPGARSSHIVPTPRGGGLSIAVVFLAVLAIYDLWHFFVAGVIVSLVGWFDDNGHINSGVRLIVHFVGACLILMETSGLPSISIFGHELDLGLYGDVIAVIAIAWLLNLFNFMDGIDGLAGMEALFVACVAGIILWTIYGYKEQSFLFFYFATSSLGFLVWNFPRAKIFLGDVGSGFIGLMLSAFIIYSLTLEDDMLWVWLILLGVFVVDATYTLIRRLVRGDKAYEAHRMHAYQHATRYYGSHVVVTCGVFLINVFWLAPIAFMVSSRLVDGVIGLLVSYAPLIILAKKFRAGEL